MKKIVNIIYCVLTLLVAFLAGWLLNDWYYQDEEIHHKYTEACGLIETQNSIIDMTLHHLEESHDCDLPTCDGDLFQDYITKRSYFYEYN